MIENLSKEYIPKLLDKLAAVKGLPVLIGLVVVIFSFIASIGQWYFPILSFFTAGQWLLHVGVIIGLGGMLFSDTL